MRRFSTTVLALAAIPVVTIWAGALLLQVDKADAYPEAKKLNAVLVVKSMACHEPAKSVITANLVEMSGGAMHRTPLRMLTIDKASGTYAVVGNVPPGSLIDLAVSNPEYQNYQPRVLIRTDAHGVLWGSVHRFFGTPPSEADVRGLLTQVD